MLVPASAANGAQPQAATINHNALFTLPPC
jgi:hypothetical protein